MSVLPATAWVSDPGGQLVHEPLLIELYVLDGHAVVGGVKRGARKFCGASRGGKRGRGSRVLRQTYWCRGRPTR